MLDSGSQISLISKTWYGQLEIGNQHFLRLPTRSVQLTLANGKRAKTENYQVWLEVEIGHAAAVGHTFLIVAGLIHNLVIGSDFLSQHECTLDYSQRIFGFRGKQILFKGSNSHASVKVGCITQMVNKETIKEKVKEAALADPRDRDELSQILESHANVFSNTPGEIKGYVHRIKVKEENYFQTKTYPIPFQYHEEVNNQIQQMLDWGIIEKGPSPYNNPLVVVKKKNGTIRICLDARKLNSVTIPERDIPPSIQELFARLSHKTLFSTLDLTASYWQMALDPRDRKYTAFRHNGQTHQFKRVPFGLINSGAGLMRCLDKVLSEEIKKHIICYVDDVVIASQGPREHLEYLKKFFSECAMKNITVNLEKSNFALPEISFLGHLVNGAGIKTHPDKVEAIERFPRPTTRKHLRSFLGLCNYYHKFYPGFAQETFHLLNLLRKGQKWTWTSKQDQEFETIKHTFLKTVMLYHPDFTRPFYVQTDSSKKGLGVVLFQIGDNGEHQVLSFSSRTLRGAEVNYTVTEQETLAIVWACNKFKQILLGSEVIIITDHRCLEFLNRSYLTNDRLIRWSLSLQKFRYRVIYCPGPENVVADILSRHPIETPPKNPLVGSEPITVMLSSTNNDVEVELMRLPYWQNIEPQYKKIITALHQMKPDATTTGRYRMNNGVLQIHIKDPDSPWKILVPQHLRISLINHVHCLIGHYGPRKTEEALRRQFYWSGLYPHVLNTLQKCLVCAKSKAPNKSYAGRTTSIIPSKPNEMLAIDHYGPLPSFKRYQYLLVTYDVFSKYVCTYPVWRADSRNAIRVLQDRQFREVGKPTVILTDHGSAFTSKEWKVWISRQGLQHVLTSIRNPQSNPCERVMREINRLYRTHIPDNHKGWVTNNQRVIHFINNTVNESTGFTPLRLHFGKSCQPLVKTPVPVDQENVVKERDQDRARQRLSHMAKLRERRGNANPHLFQVGEQVWVRVPKASNVNNKQFRKFFPLYQGPYHIQRKCGNNAFILASDGIYKGIFNARSLKPYYDIPPDPGKI